MQFDDVYWMQQALDQAAKAETLGEVPVGAVLVKQNTLIAADHNRPISLNDPTAHAELLVLRAGALQLGNYRLVDTCLYVTLEPCLMCAGAMVHSRIGRLVYGAKDPKGGAVASQIQILEQSFLNHRVIVNEGILQEPCSHILTQFFKGRRQQVA